jgi:uncharacterized protein YbjT (DUF2867 family)
MVREHDVWLRNPYITCMNIIVFGPTGGTGRAVIAKMLADGHTVTAFARDPSKLSPAPGLTIVKGDAMNPADVKHAIPGHDTVVISLGNPQLAIAISLGARRTTPADICEIGTRNIVAALGPTSPVRVLAVTSFGVGDTRDKMQIAFKIFSQLLLREAMADKERQEAVLKASDLDYVLVQPVGLTDTPASGDWVASAKGETRKMRMSRKDVAAFIADEIANPLYHRQTVALSG